MSDPRAESFLDRLLPHIPELKGNRFSHKSWRYQDRPTDEGVGLVPGLELDVRTTLDCILDVEEYPKHIQFVAHNYILERYSDSDLLYVQQMSLPLIGGIQVALHMADYGEMAGYRVIAYAQDDAATEELNRKTGGLRTEYSLGAWLVSEEHLFYALSSCPRRSDIGSFKFAIMTRGAHAVSGEVLRKTIKDMADWSAGAGSHRS